MRTLVGPAESEPGPRITFAVAASASTSATPIVWWAVSTSPAVDPSREPYRATAYVGKPIREIEE